MKEYILSPGGRESQEQIMERCPGETGVEKLLGGCPKGANRRKSIVGREKTMLPHFLEPNMRRSRHLWRNERVGRPLTQPPGASSWRSTSRWSTGSAVSKGSSTLTRGTFARRSFMFLAAGVSVVFMIIV